jgi:hypothetical protein
LKIAIVKAGGNEERVFVLSIPDYGSTPFGKSNQTRISTEIDQYNAINKEIADNYKVQYFDITGISRQSPNSKPAASTPNSRCTGPPFALRARTATTHL